MPFHMIDMERYPRKAHFDYFRSLAYPAVGVTVDVDVTPLAEWSKKNGASFYLLFIHAAALAADQVPQLRQRIRDGGIAEYQECPTSHTEAKPDGAYCYCTLRHHMPLAQYLEKAEAARRQCRENGSIQEEEDVESYYFVSTLPWLHYSALIQPFAGGDDSNPRITWGKFEKNAAGRYIMPVTLLAHHALVDGIHIAAFYQHLDQQIQAIAKEAISMSDPKKEQKELDWGDQIPEESDTPDPGDKTYRDGSAVNECWNEKSENV